MNAFVLRSLAVLFALAATSSFADVFYGKNCKFGTAEGWYTDEACTQSSGAAPAAGNTYIINKGRSTAKTGKATFLEGAVLQFGDETTYGEFYTSGSTHTIPTCHVYAGKFSASSDNTEIEAGTWTFFSTKNRSSFTFRSGRDVLLSSAMKAISAADVVVDCYGRYPAQGATCYFQIEADMSEWLGSFNMATPSQTDYGVPVQLRLNSATAMGCATDTYADAFVLSAGYALCIGPSVLQTDKRGFSVSLAAEAKIAIDTSLYGDFSLVAPIVGGPDGTIEKCGTGSLMFNGPVCVTNVLVSEGSVAFGPNAQFADGTLVHILLGASCLGTVPQNVTLVDDNDKKKVVIWTGGGSDAKLTTPENWEEGKVPEDLAAGTVTVKVEGGTAMAVDTAAVLNGLTFELPAGTEDFALEDAGGSVSIGDDGISLGTADVSRTYHFGVPMTLAGKQVVEVPSNVSLEFDGAISSGLSDTLAITSAAPCSVSFSGNNESLLGGLAFYDCAVKLSSCFAGGTGNSSSVGFYYTADNDIWGTTPVVALTGKGATTARPVNITPLVKRAATRYLLHAEAGTTNILGAVDLTGIGGSVYVKLVFDADSRTVIDGFGCRNAKSVSLQGEGEVELARFLVPSGTSDLGPVTLAGSSLTAIISGQVQKYSSFTVNAGNAMRFACADALTASKRKTDEAGQICINGSLDIGGFDQTLWELSGTGSVSSAQSPAAIEALGRDAVPLTCELAFGTGVSLNVSSGQYALTAASASDGVLTVSGTGVLSLAKGAEWTNGTLVIANNEKVELGKGSHRFDRFFVGETEIPAGVYCADSAPSAVAAVLTGSGRLCVGGAMSGAAIIVR